MRRLSYVLIFLLALAPRVLALDAFVAPDEGKWIYRSAHFLQALRTGDLAQTTSAAATPEVEVLAPAVPTMWTGALGLLLKYTVDGGDQWGGSLETYLQAIPDQTEKISLGFYPWTRLPTALLTGLAVLIFYVLLLKLIDPGAAFLAALLIALDPFFLGLSRVVHHDALVTIFILFSLLTLLIYRRQPTAALLLNPWLIVSGYSGGLALVTKPTAGYLVIFVGLFLLLERNLSATPAGWRQRLLAGLVWGGAAVVALLITWPALWVAPGETLAALWQRSTSAVEDNNNYGMLPAPGSPLPELGFLFYPVNWLFKTTLPVLIGLLALLLWGRAPLSGGDPAIDRASRWTVRWLTVFVCLFWLLLLPADTRDIRYFLPGALVLYILAAVGLAALGYNFTRLKLGWLLAGLLLLFQAGLAVIYFPYFVNYWNPAAAGPRLAPVLVKIGSGEGLDRMGRYLSQKPGARDLTVATSFWESFVPFFPGHYTKAHYDDEADYILIYIRQIQNRNPFPEYWTYFSARKPEHTVSLAGIDYAWLYPGPQLRVVRDVAFEGGLALRGYRLDQPAAEIGRPANLTLVWAGVTPALAEQMVTVHLADELGNIWAESSGPVLSVAGPSPVEGRYTLSLPADIAPGEYDLWVSMNPDTGERQYYAIGSIPVRSGAATGRTSEVSP